MKKIVTTWLLSMGMLVLAGMPAQAADSINFDGNYEKNGTSITMTLNVDKGGATSGQLELTYDSTKVELVSVELGEALEDVAVSSIHTADAGSVSLGFANRTEIAAGEVLTAEFTALTEEAVVFPVTVEEWSGETRNDLLADVVDTTVDIDEKAATALTVKKTKTTYEVGDTLNVDDVTVTAAYEDGTTKAVTGYTTNAANVDMNTAGSKALTVSFKGVTKDVAITVKGHTVTFDANGGTSVSSKEVTTHNAAVGTLPTTTREDYDFAGWYTAATGTTAVTAETKVDKSMTVYAQWTKKAVIPDTPGTPENPTPNPNPNPGIPGDTVVAPTAPGKVQISSVTSKKSNKVTVAYKAVANAKGYEVVYANAKSFAKTKTIDTTALSANIKSAAGKTYYVKVRAYVLDAAGAKVYGDYSAVKNVTTKPNKVKSVTLKSKKKGQLAITIKKVANAKGYEIIYSTNKKFTKATTKKKLVSKSVLTFKNLKKGKTYYVKVRAYTKDAKGKKVYSSAYSKVKQIKIKK